MFDSMVDDELNVDELLDEEHEDGEDEGMDERGRELAIRRAVFLGKKDAGVVVVVVAGVLDDNGLFTELFLFCFVFMIIRIKLFFKNFN